MKYDYEEQFTDALKKITDNNLKKKLVAIKKLVCERMKLENDFKKEHNKLEAKYDELYQPIYEKRKNIIQGITKPNIEEIKDKLSELKISEEEAKKENENGIPEFWSKCLENSPDVQPLNDKDKEILKKLIDLKCESQENGNFTLIFTFEPNDYFTDTELRKEFIVDEESEIKEIKCTEIDWKSDEKNPTIEIKKKKMKNKKTKEIKTVTKRENVASFFGTFKNMTKNEDDKNKNDDDDDEEDEDEEMTIDEQYDMGLQFKEEIIPYAIEYYLDIVDDEESLGNEDEEIEEEEEEEEEKHKKKKDRKKRK